MLTRLILWLILFADTTPLVGQELFGMTFVGGNYNDGTIFKYNIALDSLIKLYDFDSINGADPRGSLILGNDRKLWGLTASGGANNAGVIFQFDPVTNILTKKYDLAKPTGSNPYGTMVQFTDGKFYGVTTMGGANNGGAIFKFDPVSNSYEDLYDFDTGDTATLPIAGLVISNNKLYGGAACAIFSYVPDSEQYAVEFRFPFPEIGSFWGGMISVSDHLYGLALQGQNATAGFVYEFNPVDSVFSINNYFSNNINSAGNLVLATNGKMYGTAYNQLSNDSSTIFQYDTATNSITTIYTFMVSNGDGFESAGGLIQGSNGILYGMNSEGGSFGGGTIFSYNYSTNVYTKLVDLNDSTGTSPFGNLLQASDCSDCTGIKNITASNNLAIYPNPATSQVTIQAAGINQGAVAQITDLTGRALITNYSTQPGKFIFDIQILAAGSYLVEVRQDNLTYTGKLVKLN